VDHHDDVMQFNTLDLPKPCWSEGVSKSKIESQRLVYKGSGAFSLYMSKQLVKL